MIYTQSNRNINQILYDYNNEPINRPISKDQITYRRNEQKWIQFFKIVQIIICIICVVNFTIFTVGIALADK
jgi:t-SNARE complex subunit (syntaxin)